MTLRISILALALIVLGFAPDDRDKEPFQPVPDRNGVLTLPAARASVEGKGLRLTDEDAAITGWGTPNAVASWRFTVPESKTYLLIIEYAATGKNASRAEVEAQIGRTLRMAPIHATGDDETFLPQPMVDPVALKAGTHRLDLRALKLDRGMTLLVKRIRLVPDAERGDGP